MIILYENDGFGQVLGLYSYVFPSDPPSPEPALFHISFACWTQTAAVKQQLYRQNQSELQTFSNLCRELRQLRREVQALLLATSLLPKSAGSIRLSLKCVRQVCRGSVCDRHADAQCLGSCRRRSENKKLPERFAGSCQTPAVSSTYLF